MQLNEKICVLLQTERELIITITFILQEKREILWKKDS